MKLKLNDIFRLLCKQEYKEELSMNIAILVSGAYSKCLDTDSKGKIFDLIKHKEPEQIEQFITCINIQGKNVGLLMECEIE